MQRVGVKAAIALGCAGVALMAPDAVGSGGHYVVDAAALLERGRCGVDAWYSRSETDAQQLVAEPVCNLTGNLDLALTLSRFRDGDGWGNRDRGQDPVPDAGPRRLGLGPGRAIRLERRPGPS